MSPSDSPRPWGGTLAPAACSRKGESLGVLEGGNAVMRAEALLDFGRGARLWLEMGFAGHSSELAVTSP